MKMYIYEILETGNKSRLPPSRPKDTAENLRHALVHVIIVPEK
jgi:hypothetical protein